jgi:hypothetical protein
MGGGKENEKKRGRTHVTLELVLLLMSLNECPCGTFHRRASDLLLRIGLILIHPDVIDLVFHGRVEYHLAETLREAARLLEATSAVVCLAWADGGTLFRETY